MTDSTTGIRDARQLPPKAARGLAVVLGTNEIASAAGVYLHRAGWPVVLSHDPYPPVLRRRVAFHDVLFGDAAEIEDVKGTYAGTAMNILAITRKCEDIAVTPLDILDLLVIGKLDILVDARMQKYQVKPDLRWIAGASVGLGPGFEAGTNCDIAIETHPAKMGTILNTGRTEEPDRKPALLGNAGIERFVYASEAGQWHTSIEIGTRVFKDFVVGHLNGTPVRAPFDGLVRGLVRDGLAVPDRTKLLEIDPRRRKAKCTGIDARGRAIGKAAVAGILAHATLPALNG